MQIKLKNLKLSTIQNVEEKECKTWKSIKKKIIKNKSILI